MEASPVQFVPESARKPLKEAGGFITALHGNCVFSDAELPVKIDHYSNGAVVSQYSGSETGVVHFPLSMVLLHGPQEDHGPVPLALLKGLEIDMENAHSGPGRRDDSGASRVVEAEIYLGCKQYWCGTLNKANSFTVRLDHVVQPMDLLHPKGIGVTLKIKWGGDALRFCSVAFFGGSVNGSSGPPRPE